MKKMIRALITQREEVNAYGGLCDSLEREYGMFFSGLGVSVFPVCSHLGDVDAIISMEAWDLLILSGGGALPRESGRGDRAFIQTHRDTTEKKLLRWAFESGIPVMGICRGMQVINLFLGGTVSGSERLLVRREVRIPHPVRTADGRQLSVNHYHSDCVLNEDLALGLEILAVDEENNSVEALAGENKPVFGVQWHPERASDPDVAEWVKRQMKERLHLNV